jgi:EpsI family protein
MAVLQVDDYLMRTYINKAGQVINLYIGYFGDQREGKRIHSPRQCLPGAGWTPSQASIRRLSLEDHDSIILPVNEYLMGKGGEEAIYLFWYQGRGRTYASEYLNKLYLVWDAMTRNRTDGALVRISMSVTDSPDRTMESLNEFIRNSFSVLPQFVPE